MELSVIISGFGGQGALLAGQILAYAAMDSGLEVTWIPSYGPEMRGGTAHCTVVIGDQPIGSPLVRSPDIVVAMNLPSADAYEPQVRKGGAIIWDGTLVTREAVRSDIRVFSMPASAIAAGLGDGRLVNMAMVGALCEVSGAVAVEQVERALRTHLPERHRKLLEANICAVREGASWVCDAERGYVGVSTVRHIPMSAT